MAARVQFKFRDGTTGDDRQRVIAQLEDYGADSVERLFPDAADEELATVYSAVAGDAASCAELVRLLRRSRKIEFAEPAPDRRLILPVTASSPGRRRRAT